MDYSIIDTIHVDTIVITFINEKYYPLFKVFYKYYQQHNLDNLLVICLDEPSHVFCQKINLRTALVPYNIDKMSEFWRFRLSLINSIFKYSEKNIIHTDVDCFWLKNIMQIFDSLDNYDLIGHIAFGHPHQIVEKIGFVFCCGLYYLRYNNKNMYFLDEIISQRLNFVDDQVYLNHYIYENLLLLRDPENTLLFKEIVLNDQTIIGILQNSVVSRHFNKDLYGFHPFLGSNDMTDKLKELEKFIDISDLHT
jgi:hypothetical protein